jgi:hypothetical protein
MQATFKRTLQIFGVAGAHEIAFGAVRNDIGACSAIGRDYGYSAGHRFEQNKSEAVTKRRQYQNVTAPVQSAQRWAADVPEVLVMNTVSAFQPLAKAWYPAAGESQHV